ncbi:nitroreductase family protein [Chlorobium sp. N1]|uniref:nitroreductase family protein n=1 Tax=Chlorobium sp. N1 TaxID=2491138 RepID=UPI00103D26E1|nr:nitroreductase family protein [Chlorobium sp. N1]TCD47439.1 nitroreductase family protein [Chlorobium sp. N1]
MKRDFLEAVACRRSIYAIGPEPCAGYDRVAEVVRHALLHAPSTFNSQSARAVVLTLEPHRRLWDIVLDTLKGLVPEDAFRQTALKISGFRAGAGTVMFFEDQAVVRDLQERYPLYADKFPEFSLQSSGMAQFIVWTALSDEGCGASLQHYNPLIDEAVAAEWNLPSSWRLISQLVFGSVREAPLQKSFSPIEDRVLVIGE